MRISSSVIWRFAPTVVTEGVLPDNEERPLLKVVSILD
jgi:hypothetical protein